jgi:molybdopterin molybdotransferase
MDGWAVRSADGGAPRRPMGESRAGAPWTGQVGAGEAIAISTGAVLPSGADAVVPVERAEQSGEHIEITGPVITGDHVRPAGGDIDADALLLPAGHRVAAHELATLAGAGVGDVACHARPRVALLSSGDEVRPAGELLSPGQVHDGNRPALAAQIPAAGGELVACEIVGDDRAATVEAVRRLGAQVDALITTGGVSVGPHDHLRPAFGAAGVERIFWGVRVRPGSPLWFGAGPDIVVLGLPGHTVSAVVGMHVFGRALLGADDGWGRRAPLALDYPRATPREELIRCRMGERGLEPLPRQASHAVTSLVADVLARVPEGDTDLAAGTPLAWTPFR